jgi:hypothetical protein
MVLICQDTSAAYHRPSESSESLIPSAIHALVCHAHEPPSPPFISRIIARPQKSRRKSDEDPGNFDCIEHARQPVPRHVSYLRLPALRCRGGALVPKVRNHTLPRGYFVLENGFVWSHRGTLRLKIMGDCMGRVKGCRKPAYAGCQDG